MKHLRKNKKRPGNYATDPVYALSTIVNEGIFFVKRSGYDQFSGRFGGNRR